MKYVSTENQVKESAVSQVKEFYSHDFIIILLALLLLFYLSTARMKFS